VLGQLPLLTDKNVLVDSSNSDDAGVYRITEKLAVVLTVDFFTPIVDDPYHFGAIAAANSLSDIYAMGAKPLVALNVAMFPPKSSFFPTLKQIMQGGIDKMTEAGVSIIGGHTIRDKEPKYGYAVLGAIHPNRILDNSKAKVGDALILTKKIGTGIIGKGIKDGLRNNDVIKEVTISMMTLNKKASEIMLKVGVSTTTDITGFGLIGHLYEVLTASKCSARVYSNRIPFFEDAIRLVELQKVPGGTIANMKTYEPYVKWNKTISDSIRILMNDAQTSGGLLIFVPADKKERLVTALNKENILAAHIGDVFPEELKGNKRIFVD
jgi:selenide,water dikinase